MGTKIRAGVSLKNKYWISKHRYYELKHFCLQYPQWKKEYENLGDVIIHSNSFVRVSTDNKISEDEICQQAIARIYYSDKIDMIEKAAAEADSELYNYILKAVTEELSYTYLKSRLEIPCSKDMYYDRYRRFFWFLSKERG